MGEEKKEKLKVVIRKVLEEQVGITIDYLDAETTIYIYNIMHSYYP